YMEEASVLGKRIGIISDGKMKCIGTPLFLIERFGKFMSINVCKEENAEDDKIIEFFQQRSPNVEYEKLSEEIIFRIPKSDFKGEGNKETNEGEKGNQKMILEENSEPNSKEEEKKGNSNFSFESFFNDLDSGLEELKIKSYSAAMPTLEDVFLNVASSEIGKEAEEHNKEEQMQNDKILFEENFFGEYTACQKFTSDLGISLKKRLFQVLRDVRTFVLEILCPILLVLIGLAVSKVNFFGDSDPIYPEPQRYIDHTNIYYAVVGGGSISDYLDISDDLGGVLTYKEISGVSGGTIGEAAKDFMLKLYEKKDTDTLASVVYKGDEFYVFLNAEMREGNSVFVPFFAKRFLEKKKSLKIDYYHHALPLMAEVMDKIAEAKNSMLAMFASIAFSLIPANFVTLIVKERLNNSKHLMKVSGITLTSYWLSNYIFEIIKYYFEGGIIMILIIIFNYMPRYFYLIYLLYGPAMVSFTYMVSFLFESESGAQNGLILINLLFGSLATTVCLALRQVDSLTNIGKGMAWGFRLIPSFCLGHGFSMLLNRNTFLYTEVDMSEILKVTPIWIIKMKWVGADLVYLAVEGVLCILILALIEKCSYRMSVPPREKLTSSETNDSMVQKEIDRAQDKLQQDEVAKLNNETEAINVKTDEDEVKDYAVRVQNIKKTYRKSGQCACCAERVDAVKNLNFCIEYGECFGMLGINGAGKTTMFKCITQEIAQSNGAIFINGVDTAYDFEKVHDKFGYCPQFDAIFEYLTTYENLEFYAKIKGVADDKIERMIKAMMNEMALSQ
ncbi:MAG: ABC transporter permease, partial [archaeon]|nr:ABC transporter permease [archaeon]